MSQTIETVLIYGYGVMGRGVAKTFADAGFKTIVMSRRAAGLRSLPANTVAVGRLPERAPDLVIEFVPEDLETKRSVYAEIENAYRDARLLIASGTSGLDLVELAANLEHPERFLGIHYFMPAEATPVVEVMAGPATSPADVDRAAKALERTGKEPVLLYKPIIGFLVNRLQHAILHEAYYLIEAGVASAADIDHAARRLLAPRMCLNGLIRQKDISGLRIHADAQCSIVPHLFHNRTPCALLQDMVARGETGLAGGKGFYDWQECDAESVRKQATGQLQQLLQFLETGLGPAAPGTQPTRRSTASFAER